MKKKLLLVFFIAASMHSFSQKTDLVSFEKQHIRYIKNSMLTLGAWSAANMVVSGIASNTNNRELHYFHNMNMLWCGTNLVFAGLGYWGATKQKTDNLTLAGVITHQNNTEKTFALNVGLDLAYITGGAYLTERSRRQADPSRLKGYGDAVILQGAFLFLFDATMYTIHHHHGKQLNKMINKVQLTGGPGGVSLAFNL